MKIVSWNVAGISACVKKGLKDYIKKEDAEIYCFQEVKASQEKINDLFADLNNYQKYSCFSVKKGYSGVSIFTKIEPFAIIEGLGIKKFDQEGRVITLEFENFFLINAYFPHSSRDLKRLNFKLEFNKEFEKFCEKLEKMKPIVIASDFNVAHQEIDLANPKQNEKNAGFTLQERKWFDSFLKKGHTDTYREFVKERGHYTWWTYRNDARKRNIGWRIDYFVVSTKILKNIRKSEILEKVYGSDHCPILLVY